MIQRDRFRNGQLPDPVRVTAGRGPGRPRFDGSRVLRCVNLIASGVDADRIPLGLEREAYLNDRTELKRLVDVAFDRVREMLTAMGPEDLRAEGKLFGQIPQPKWKIIQGAYEHGVWTLGATVPYVRLQGGTPHSYSIVP